MKIVDLKAYEVAIPWEGVLLWTYGVGTYVASAQPRTVIEVFTDEGIVGLGEGGAPREVFEGRVKEAILGLDPFHYRTILRKLQPYRATDEATAVEFACWDIMGKALGRPVCEIIGGGDYRARVPCSAYVFFRAPNEEGEGQVNLENHAAHCQELIERFGFRTLKLKLGVYGLEEEVEAVKRVREAVGPKVKIRIDPNRAWTLPQALWAVRELEGCRLEYLESLTPDIWQWWRLREVTKAPICADGVYTRERLLAAFRSQSCDVVMCDIHGSGGIAGCKGWFDMAGALGLGLSMHSGRRVGISHAAKLHVAAAVPHMDHAIDAHYHQLTDDIIAGGKLPYQDGYMRVPLGPGLGIELDHEKLREYAFTGERKERLIQFTGEIRERIAHLGLRNNMRLDLAR